MKQYRYFLVILLSIFSCNSEQKDRIHSVYRYTTDAFRFKYMYRIEYVNLKDINDTMYYYLDSNDPIVDMKSSSFELGERDITVRATRVLGKKHNLSDPMLATTCTEFNARFHPEYVMNYISDPRDEPEKWNSTNTVIETHTTIISGGGAITIPRNNAPTAKPKTDWGIYGNVPRDETGREIHIMPNGESKVWNGSNWTCPDCP